MKSEGAIRSRLMKLRRRYRNKHAFGTQKRRHVNCVYNAAVEPRTRKPPSVLTELEMAPRVVSSLVIFQDDSPIHICMYGSESPGTWNGDVCDSDEVAERCEFFKPKVTRDEAAEEFDGWMEDDKFVFNNYKDVATLQWVLEDRVHQIPLTWRDRLSVVVKRVFDWFLRRNGRKPPQQIPAIPENMWDRDDSD